MCTLISIIIIWIYFKTQRKLLLLIVANYSHEFKIRVSKAMGSYCKIDDINDDDDDDDDFCVL